MATNTDSRGPANHPVKPGKISQTARSTPDSTPEFTTTIGSSRQELWAAYHLIYTKYVKAKLIADRPGEIVYLPAFGLATGRTLIARSSRQPNQVAGTLSIVGDSPLGLSVEQTFPEAVSELRASARRLVELTCLAIRNGGIPVFASLTQFAIQYAMWRGYDDLLMTIHPRHARFYRRCFGAEPIGPCRNHRLVSNRPAFACRIDLNVVDCVVAPTVRESYLGRKIAISELGKGPMSASNHEFFCSLAALTPDSRAA